MTTPQSPQPAGGSSRLPPAGLPSDRYGAHEVSRWIETLFLTTRERT